MRRATAVFLLWATVALLGCASGEDVTGIWRTRDGPVALPPNTEGPRFLEGSYVTLAVAQYGRDVAGVVKFYESPSATIERCPCSYVFNGVLRGNRLTFLFEACTPDMPETALMRAELQLVGTDDTEIVLTGEVYLLDPSIEDAEDAVGERYFTSLTLQGTRQTKIPSYFLRCATDSAAAPTPDGGE